MARIDESRPFLPVNIAVLTVSDTRTEADDKSGRTLAEPRHRRGGRRHLSLRPARLARRLPRRLGGYSQMAARQPLPPVQPGGADAAPAGAPHGRRVGPVHTEAHLNPAARLFRDTLLACRFDAAF